MMGRDFRIPTPTLEGKKVAIRKSPPNEEAETIMEINSINTQNVAPKTEAQSKEDVKLRKACQDFEALLLSQMLTKMRETVPKTDLFGSSEKEEIFQGMLDQEIAKEMANSSTMGIAELMYSQLSKNMKIR